jgi:hypothetical protein
MYEQDDRDLLKAGVDLETVLIIKSQFPAK